ncbi:MAG TPA: DUF4136 domain-containing protein [Myxococcales bacterium]|jgi:hypothetical protein
MRARAIVWALGLSLAACSSVPVQPSTAHGASKRLEGYRTYAWLPGPLCLGDGDSGDSAAIRSAADRELSGKGYRRIDSSTADFYVRSSVTVTERTSVEAVDPSVNERVWEPLFGEPVGGSGAETGSIVRYEQVRVGLEVIDGASRAVQWSASVWTDLRPEPSEQEKQKSVEKAVRELASALPG